MQLRVRLFAVLRERAGAESLEIELDEGATVAEALRELAARSEPLAAALGSMEVVMAVNRSYAKEDAPLAPGDELALIPPVSGGESGGRLRPHVLLTDRPLSAERLQRAVITPHTGAVVTFQGTTRDVERLDYEAYAEMAIGRIERILDDAIARHEIEAAAAEHRTGGVPRGETSVLVAVAAPHREAAFAAAREAVDRIKAEAPIWKREVDGGRGAWVEGTRPRDEGTPSP